MFAEDFFDRHRLEFIVIWRRSAVSIDIGNRVRRQPRVLDGLLHYTNRARASLVWHCDVKGIAACSIANNFRKYLSPTCLREFEFFQNQNPRSLTDRKSVV